MFHAVLSYSSGPHYGHLEAFFYWLNYYSPAIQALFTVVIVSMTYWQSRMVREQSKAMMEQSETMKKELKTTKEAFELEWYPDLHVEMIWGESYDEAKVTNLGRSTALLLGFTLRRKNAEKTFKRAREKNDIVFPGTSVLVPVTRGLLEYFRETGLMDENNRIVGTIGGPYEISFSFYSAGKVLESAWFEFLVDNKGRLPRGT